MIARKPQPERVHTDDSLRTERKNADDAVSENRSAEQVADRIVDRARSEADAVVDQARHKADSKVATGDAGVADVLAAERRQEDSLLGRERADADERLRLERAHQALTLENVLLRERANTDRYLLTERSRSDDAIANRDDFLGMVSHDLNNLLQNINLNAVYLSASASDSEEGARTVAAMERVQRDVDRMGDIIKDLVDIVSIDAGKLAIRPRPDNARRLLTEAADAYSVAAGAKDITVIVESPEKPLLGSFDQRRMSQVIANCVSNAVKFTPPGGLIVLRGECVGDEIRLSISDTGPGIPPAMLEAVFERFWQVGKDDQRGLGLGLYIAKCIVTGHHGRIWFENAADVGATLHCVIPRAAPQAAADAPMSGTAPTA
ncbi:MAG TPA: HAMP domain-containing sensor histidine kinase [Verrucomicrobiae bacterium]|nr:HAMP domain-containing sensor histidine kinase [Verrucomicrobiae bacterium]